jgi:hypothetical protein
VRDHARVGGFEINFFAGVGLGRQRLLWALAVRRQLERWEPLVAEDVREGFSGSPGAFDGEKIWRAQYEHHFLLVAAHHLLRALEIDPPSTVAIEPTVRAELTEGRHLHEHSIENIPVFNQTPRVKEPKHPSGKAFAARNPRSTPYNWLSWSSSEGAQLLPNVYAPQVHALVDAVEAEVLEAFPQLARFVPPRAASPWIAGNDGWWPLPA